MSTFFQRFSSFLPSRGFTLTELVVVVAIMTLLTSVFLLQQRQFDSTTLLRSLAYSVALSIREAQTYGLSVRSFTTATDTEFPAYGVYFNPTTYPTEYFLFADVNDNGQYDPATEFVDRYALQGNFTIVDVCAVRGGTPECYSDNLFTEMAVTFRRPNPDACVATDGPYSDVCGASPTPAYSSASIQIEGPGGATRSVTVRTSGQISVGMLGS